MVGDTKPFPETVTRAIFIAAVLIFGLRLAVARSLLRSSEPDAGMQLALGVMGLGFLICGLIAVSRVRTVPSHLFALYCLGQAIHWGGPPEVASQNLQVAIWLAYFVISMLGISAILHFTLLFPNRWPLADRRFTPLFLYGPVALAALLAVLRMVLTGPRGDGLQSAFFALEMLQINLYGLMASVVIAIRFARASRTERRAGLGAMLAGVLLGQLPYLTASILAPDIAQPLTFFFLLIPIAVTQAILQTERRRSRSLETAP